MFKYDIPILIFIYVLLILMGFVITPNVINFWEGLVLFLLMIAYTVFLIIRSKNEPQEEEKDDKPRKWYVNVLFIIIGLAGIIFGGDFVANEQNLVPFTSEQSHEEAVKNGRKGGIASGEARRNRKMLRDCLDYLLEKVDNTALDENGNAMSGAEQLAYNLFVRALGEPDTAKAAKAFEVLRDTAGQKPVEKIVVSEIDSDVIEEVERMVNDDEGTSG